jgi:peptide/nickel transport system ATP-binding protein
MNDTLLEVKNLSIEFRTYDGVVKAINDMSFRLPKGKTIGLVGESGAGKTTTALAIIGLVPYPPGFITGGDIIFEGKSLLKLSDAEMQKLRGDRISMIFQNPMTSLNPVYTVGRQIAGVIALHQKLGSTQALQKAGDMLEVVGIPRARLNNYPHEFSGGMKQRVCIAMGLACNPDLLIADEPTTALDVTIQAQILDLMRDLKRQYNTSTIFITHALGVVNEIADYVMVAYAGSIIEQGTLEEVFRTPTHPYTKGLFGCLPGLETAQKRLHVIQGAMPDPMCLPRGCKFCERCGEAVDKCREEEPAERHLSGEHRVRCHLYAGEVG